MLNPHICLNLFALLVGTCHIAVILVYFFGSLKDGSRNYISHILSNNRLYMNLMTFFVLLQLSVCFVFVRMHALTSSVTRVLVECLFLAVAWIGWCVLIIQYKIHGEVSHLHFLGVGLFVGVGMVYFAFLIWEMHASSEDEDSVLVSLYCATVVLAFLFILGFFCKWDCAWIFEHAAFLMFSVAHNYLFYADVRCDEEMRRGLFDSLRIEPKHTCLGVTDI